MIIDSNTLKKKNPSQKPFWECEKYLQKCFCEGIPINWSLVSMCYELPDWFISLHIDKLNWDSLTRWQDFNEETLRQFQDYINWDQLNPNGFSLDFCREMKGRFCFNFFALDNNKVIDEFGGENYDQQIINIEKRMWWERHKNDFGQ